jgi:hypothetical protein
MPVPSRPQRARWSTSVPPVNSGPLGPYHHRLHPSGARDRLQTYRLVIVRQDGQRIGDAGHRDITGNLDGY